MGICCLSDEVAGQLFVADIIGGRRRTNFGKAQSKTGGMVVAVWRTARATLCGPAWKLLAPTLSAAC